MQQLFSSNDSDQRCDPRIAQALPRRGLRICESSESTCWQALSDPLCIRSPAHGHAAVGGDKIGNDRWYDAYVPLADRRYDEHLA
jgi:hypothetical protein